MNGLYDFIDQPVGELCQGSRLLLWSLRAWADALARKSCPPGAIAPAYAVHALLPAVQDLHMAAALLNSNGRTKFMLAPIPARRVSEDEALLIALWRDIALDNEVQAQAVLDICLDRQSVGPVLAAVRAHAGKLAEAGLSPLGLVAAETAGDAS